MPKLSALDRNPVSSCSRLEFGKGLPGIGHAVLVGLTHPGRERGGIEFLAGIDADLGETRAQRGLGRIGRAELQDEIQEAEKIERGAFRIRRQRLWEIDGGRGRRRRPAEKLRQGLDFVARLNPLHVVDVAGIEELRADEQERELGLRVDHRLYVRRLGAVPIRPGEQEAAGAIAGGAAAHIGEVERVHVDELDRVIAALVDRRHRDHQRLGAQVGADERIGRLGIGRLDRLVVGRIDARVVDQRVPGRLVFRAAAIDEIRILDPVAVDQRKTPDDGVLGDGAHFRRRHALRLRWRGKKRGGNCDCSCHGDRPHGSLSVCAFANARSLAKSPDTVVKVAVVKMACDGASRAVRDSLDLRGEPGSALRKSGVGPGFRSSLPGFVVS